MFENGSKNEVFNFFMENIKTNPDKVYSEIIRNIMKKLPQRKMKSMII